MKIDSVKHFDLYELGFLEINPIFNSILIEYDNIENIMFWLTLMFSDLKCKNIQSQYAKQVRYTSSCGIWLKWVCPPGGKKRLSISVCDEHVKALVDLL